MSTSREIWFARRHELARGGGRMVPVHWKGYAMFGVFAGALVIGGLIFAACAMNGAAALGVTLYVVMAVLGVAALFLAVLRHSDNTRTYKDYRAQNASNR